MGCSFAPMKKTLLLTTLLLVCALLTFANEGSGIIKGKVRTADGKPAAFVTVQIKGSRKSTVTGEDGIFVLKGIGSGSHEVEISLVGYATAIQSVTIQDNETVNIAITLQLSESQLKEVVFTGGKRKFIRRSSDYVARLPLKNLENPQVYNTISAELLKEQSIVNFDDAIKNAPGIDKLWSSTGRGGDGAAYYSIRGFSVQPSMINGISGQTNGGLDPANIERLEVIKGPSGTLFGSSLVSFGGLTNIVTKKPYDSLGGEITYTGGGFGLNRLAFDLNTPVDKDRNVLLRVNGAYHYENSFQDAGFKKSFFLAPSLTYKVNDKLNFQLNSEFYNGESTSALMVFINRTRKLVATNPAELGMDYKRSFTSNDVTMKTPTVNIYAQANYKISDSWTSQTNFSHSNRKSDGYYQYVMFNLPGDSLLNRYVSDQHSTTLATDIQQNFIGDFRIGTLRNRIVAGIDYYQVKTINNSLPYVLFDTVRSAKEDPKYTRLTRSALDARFAQSGTPAKTNSTSSTYSAYVSDVLNLTDELMAMLSLRVDRFDNKGTYNLQTMKTTGAFAQTSFSPKFGLIYQLVKDRLSVFGNYMNGFRNVAAVTQPDQTVSNFKPQQANQWEGGIKADLLDGKLTGTLSYYDIYVTNVTRPDPEKAGFTVQDGNISSKGFEADVIANPIPGLNIIAGYSYNTSRNDKTDSTINKRRPVSSGPEQLVNAWISYTAVQGLLKGAGIGIGGNYASGNLITNNAVNGQFTLPSYTVLNATLFYNAKTFRIAVKVDNLTDKRYYKGWTTMEPQMLRRVSATIGFRF